MPISFFSVGFRPFFAFGVLFGAIALAVWANFWQLDTSSLGLISMAPVGGIMFWHPHELIMGFALAIVMGFLLTAVRNWTGLETAPAAGLAIILICWIWARIVMAFGADFSYNLIVVSQILPVILTAAYIANPILQKKLWRNLFAPIALVVFAILDVTLLNNMYDKNFFTSHIFQATILLLMFIITMIGGRIIPLFTANKLGVKKWDEPRTSLLLCVLPLLALIIASLFTSHAALDAFKSGCAILLVLSHSHRLVRWHQAGIWQQPMLWSLWVSYACLPIGFFLLAFTPVFEMGSIPLHVMTIGTLCGLIVSMVARVSLGHTGRNIKHDPLILMIIFCMLLATLVRTGAVILIGYDTRLIIISALLASLSLAFLFMRFIYIWLTPRTDQ